VKCQRRDSSPDPEHILRLDVLDGGRPARRSRRRSCASRDPARSSHDACSPASALVSVDGERVPPPSAQPPPSPPPRVLGRRGARCARRAPRAAASRACRRRARQPRTREQVRRSCCRCVGCPKGFLTSESKSAGSEGPARCRCIICYGWLRRGDLLKVELAGDVWREVSRSSVCERVVQLLDDGGVAAAQLIIIIDVWLFCSPCTPLLSRASAPPPPVSDTCVFLKMLTKRLTW